VEQPLRFEDPRYPNHAYMLSKALYGLKQAPRAWYERLRDFLIEKGFKIGTVDVTEPPKLLGPPTVVLILHTLDNPVGAHNHSMSSVSVSLFPRPRALHPSRRYYNTSEEQISGSELQ
jgi:hypothetical protein